MAIARVLSGWCRYESDPSGLRRTSVCTVKCDC